MIGWILLGSLGRINRRSTTNRDETSKFARGQVTSASPASSAHKLLLLWTITVDLWFVRLIDVVREGHVYRQRKAHDRDNAGFVACPTKSRLSLPAILKCWRVTRSCCLNLTPFITHSDRRIRYTRFISDWRNASSMFGNAFRTAHHIVCISNILSDNEIWLVINVISRYQCYIFNK